MKLQFWNPDSGVMTRGDKAKVFACSRLKGCGGAEQLDLERNVHGID